VQGALMVLGGVVALVYPIVSSVGVVLFLGWILILGGIVQGISLIGANEVPHFWLQLVSVVLSVIVGLLFIRNPGEGLLALAASNRVLYGRGFFKTDFCADNTTFSKLGLGSGQRGHRDTAIFLPLGQPSGNSDLAAWRFDRYPANL
jgi:short repeat uncharacterized protein DUF308